MNLFSPTDNGLSTEGSSAKPTSIVSSKSETFFTGDFKQNSEPQGLQINMNPNANNNSIKTDSNANVRKSPSPSRTPQEVVGQSKPNGKLLNIGNLGGAGESPSGTNLEPKKSKNLFLKDKKDKQNKKKKKDCILM